MRRFLLTMATAAAALTATACSDSTGINSSMAGSYELRTINGQSLPVTVNGRTYEDGVFEIDNNGEFVETLRFREFGESFSAPHDYFGTWDRNGSELEFNYDDNTRYFGERISSSRFVFTDTDGNEWSYVRF